MKLPLNSRFKKAEEEDPVLHARDDSFEIFFETTLRMLCWILCVERVLGAITQPILRYSSGMG